MSPEQNQAPDRDGADPVTGGETPSNSQLLTVVEAARATGRNRKSIYRDIKSGRLSATVSVDGKKQIAVSELLRAYGEFPTSERHVTGGETVPTSQLETVEDVALKVKVAALEAEVSQLRERLGDKDRNLEDLRASMRLLEHEKLSRKRFWARLFGGGSQ